MSHQPTDSSFLVYFCIRRTTPGEIWSPAPTCGFEKAETHTAKVQESGTLILRHGWQVRKLSLESCALLWGSARGVRAASVQTLGSC